MKDKNAARDSGEEDVMAKVAELVEWTDDVVAMAVAWYERPAPPPAFGVVDVRVLDLALRLADGEVRRVVVNGPTSVTVHNRPVW